MKLKTFPWKPVACSLLFIVFCLFLTVSEAKAEETLYFIHQDHLGSTALVTSNTGEVVSKQVYYPYGTTRAEAGNQPTERTYTSQVSDVNETGLYYYNARYYNPTIAKFTQADAAIDGTNKYAYVANNPIKYIDPTGNSIDLPPFFQPPLDDYPDVAKTPYGFIEGFQAGVADILNTAGFLDLTPNSWGLKDFVSKDEAEASYFGNMFAGFLNPMSVISSSGIVIQSADDFARALQTQSKNLRRLRTARRFRNIYGLDDLVTRDRQGIEYVSKNRLVAEMEYYGYTVIENSPEIEKLARRRNLYMKSGKQGISAFIRDSTKELHLPGTIAQTQSRSLEHEFVHIMQGVQKRNLSTLRSEYEAYMASSYYWLSSSFEPSQSDLNSIADVIYKAARSRNVNFK